MSSHGVVIHSTLYTRAYCTVCCGSRIPRASIAVAGVPYIGV